MTVLGCAALLVVSVACNGDGSDTAAEGPAPPDGPTVVVDGLDRPTQIDEGPGGRLLVAQLNGDEEEATGQVLAVDVESGERTVVLDGLDKPTGVLWVDDTLWVMQRRSLARARWPGEGRAGPLEVVLDALPWNGRSEGTLTALDDGRILYATTGSLVSGPGTAPTVTEGSGMLWAFDPATGDPEPLATGLKNAYAHTLRPEGALLTTEVGDNVDDPPPDELVLLPPPTPGAPADAGWPDCPPEQSCPGVVGPLATFPAGSTPTGVAVFGGRAHVALFVEGSIAGVDLRDWQQGDPPRPTEEIVRGLDGPHTVLARDDGTVWVSEHGAGRIVAIRP